MAVAVVIGGGLYYGFTASPTLNALSRAGNPFTSEYLRSRAFSTLRRSSTGVQRARDALTPRSSEARSGVSPLSTCPSASTNTKGSSMDALHQKSATATSPCAASASTEPPARHSGRFASRAPVTRFLPRRCAARASIERRGLAWKRAEYSSPSIRALPTLSATKKEFDWMRSRKRVVYQVAFAVTRSSSHEPSIPPSQVTERSGLSVGEP